MTQLKRHLVLIVPTVIACFMVFGLLLQRYDNSRKSDLLQFLKIIQSSLDSDDLSTLTGTEEDIRSVGFQKLQGIFTRLSNTHPSVRYIYLMRQVGDQVVFLIDSKSQFNPNNEPLATPGEIYTDTTESLFHVFSASKNSIVGPETDRWGTFISALGPVFDSQGQTIGLLGIDVDYSEWYRSKVSAFIPYLVVFFLIIVVEIVGIMYYGRLQQHLHTQAHLANIVSSSHDAIISLNLDDTVRSWNQGASEIIGYSPQEAIGKKMSDLVYLPDQKDTFNSIYPVINNGQTIRNLQVDYRTKDGRRVTVLISANPIFNGRSIVGISTVAKDITSHSHSQRVLADRNQELEKLNKLMVNREIKMAELKSQIRLLKAKK